VADIDLTEAIEAAARALVAITENEQSPCLADEEECFRIHPVHFAWYQMGETGVMGEAKAIARVALEAAAELIKAATRRQVAEELRALDPVEWALAGQDGGQIAAAIALGPDTTRTEWEAIARGRGEP
jgi:hypothetical protein